MTEKRVPQEGLNILQNFLILDQYTPAKRREGELSTMDHPEKFVPLEPVIEHLVPGFFTTLAHENHGRSGAQPLEVSLESGANASSIQFPGIAQEILGQKSMTLDFPDMRFRAFIFDLIVFLNDVNIKPANDEGSITFAWDTAVQGLRITVKAETNSLEVAGDININLKQIEILLFLVPRVSKGRMLWEWGCSSIVDREGNGPRRITSHASNETLSKLISDTVRAEMAQEISIPTFIFSLFSPGEIGTKMLGDIIAQGVADFLPGYTDLVGNAIMSIPLRPVPDLTQTMDDANALFKTCLIDQAMNNPVYAGTIVNSIGAMLNPLLSGTPIEIGDTSITLSDVPLNIADSPESFEVAKIILGYYNEAMTHAALGHQNLTNMIPFRSPNDLANLFLQTLLDMILAWNEEMAARTTVPAPVTAPDLLDTFIQITVSLFNANSSNVHPNVILSTTEVKQILKETQERVKEYVFSHLEPSHLVNRTVKYDKATVSNTGNFLSLEQEELKDKHASGSDVIKPFGVPCMYYEVKLNLIQVIGKFEGTIRTILERREQGFNDDLSYTIDWEINSFHELLDDPLEENQWNEHNTGGQLMPKETKTKKVQGKETGLADQFTKKLFLEWTSETNGLINCKLQIKGKVKMGNVELGTFQSVIPMNKLVGIYSGENDLENRKNTRFSALADTGNYQIEGTITQLPFSSAYEKIRINVLDVTYNPPQSGIKGDVGKVFQFEGLINENSFQFSEMYSPVLLQQNTTAFKKISPNIKTPLGGGWSNTVIYNVDDISNQVNLGIAIRVFDPNNLQSNRTERIESVIHRFCDEDENPVIPEETILQSAIRDATDKGAEKEWEIPAGLSYGTKKISTQDGAFTFTIQITNESYTMDELPGNFKPKVLKVEFPGVFVKDNGEDDFNPGGTTGEMQFLFNVSAHLNGQEVRNNEVPEKTRIFNMPDEEDLVFPGPPDFKISTLAEMELKISCKTTEFDPGFLWFDGDDKLTLEKEINDTQSKEILREHTLSGSHDGIDLDLRVKITAPEAPPAADIIFDGYAYGINLLQTPLPTTVMIRYAAGWGDHLVLVVRPTANPNAESQKMLDGLSGTFAADITEPCDLLIWNYNLSAEDPKPSESRVLQIR